MSRMSRNIFALCLAVIGLPVAAATLRYHGELLDRGAPANGRYDLRLAPFADAQSKAATAAAVIFEDVLVEDGFFLLEPEFDLHAEATKAVWIELGVRDADSTLAFATLPSRQKAELAPLVGQCWSTTGDSGVIAGINFLGTTDGAPLVLRSSGGIGINTSAPRDLLTLSGPNSYLDGPTINLTGTTSDQAESGRIRFVEGTAAGNFRGAYLRYDGANNVFAIGAHSNSDNLPASDVDQIVMLRSTTTRVGIGKSPSEELDVDGDIRINGGLKYFQLLNHTKLIAATQLHELGSNDCGLDGAGTMRKSNLIATQCFARARVDLPRGALVVNFEGHFNDFDSGDDCRFSLRRTTLAADGGQTDETIIASVLSVGSAGYQLRSDPLSSTLPADAALSVAFSTPSAGCRGSYARITYQLPAGFIP